MKINNNNWYTLFKLLIVVVILSLVTSLWTDRNLDFWFSYFKDVPVDIPMWASILTTIIFNAVALVGNVLAELLKFAV